MSGKNGLPKGVTRSAKGRYWATYFDGQVCWAGPFDTPQRAGEAYRDAQEAQLETAARRMFGYGN